MADQKNATTPAEEQQAEIPAEGAGTGTQTIITEGAGNQAAEKTLTQSEAEAMLKRELAKKLPKKEEMDAFKAWQESQKTEAEKREEERKAAEAAKAENESLKNELKVIRSGVSGKDSDYVLFKVSKMEGDFDDNLKKFLAENPEYTEGERQKSTGLKTQRGKDTAISGVEAAFYAKNPHLKKE